MTLIHGTTQQRFTIPRTPAMTSRRLPISSSLLAAIIYADLFDAPLSAGQLHRYQVASDYSLPEISAALGSDPTLREEVASCDEYYSLRGRETLFRLGRDRASASVPLRKRALQYAAHIANLPFVQMLAVTGALAMDNIADKPDIDLMVVATPGRVWLCRRVLIAVVRLARLRGDELCPNFVLSAQSLQLEQRDFFTAHELAQMTPLWGHSMYRRLLRENAWSAAYLPNAARPEPAGVEQERPRPRRVERILSRGAFNKWERWEMERLRAKLRPSIGASAEVVCSPEQCKGHTSLHRRSVMQRYAARLTEHGLYDVLDVLQSIDHGVGERNAFHSFHSMDEE